MSSTILCLLVYIKYVQLVEYLTVFEVQNFLTRLPALGHFKISPPDPFAHALRWGLEHYEACIMTYHRVTITNMDSLSVIK
jgi:hypothetical protein